VWRWADRRGLYEGRNVWAAQGRRSGEKRETEKLPFTVDELRTLLATKPQAKPDKHSIASTLPWVSWIAAFSGMRLNEICSLKVTDVKRERGVWFFDVTDAKTEAGDRCVPIHSRLIDLGLLDYVTHVGGDWLLPALKKSGPDKKRSWYMTKVFVQHPRKLGVVRLDDTGRDRVDFHSYRRSAIACLENARVAQSEAAQVVGHERAVITFGVYNPQGLDLRALQDVVEKIAYEGV
jgi:integrase